MSLIIKILSSIVSLRAVPWALVAIPTAQKEQLLPAALEGQVYTAQDDVHRNVENFATLGGDFPLILQAKSSRPN